MEFKDDLGKPWRYEDEGLTVTRSCVWSPPGCHPVGCGVKFYADAEGKLVKVEGDENQPVTKGRLCPRCLTLKDYVNHPDRIKYPMKRDPKYRGQADKWERISWEEAFDLIESEWKRITDKYGPTSVAVWVGTGREGDTFMPYAAAIPSIHFGHGMRAIPIADGVETMFSLVRRRGDANPIVALFYEELKSAFG